jgi:hypothetical protein
MCISSDKAVKQIKRRYPMTKITRNIITAVALGMLIAGVSGCKKEGPLEKAGKEIDRAAEKTGDKIKDAVK